MGSYLKVGGEEMNSKCNTSVAIDLMRKVLPEKKSLYGEKVFALSVNEMTEVCAVSCNITASPYDVKDVVDAFYPADDENAHCPFCDREDEMEMWRTYVEVNAVLCGALFRCLENDDDGVMCKWC